MDWDRTTGTLLLLALRGAGLIHVDEPTSATNVTSRSTNPLGVSPRQLLGVGVAPDEDEIELAYVAHIERVEADLARAVTDIERRPLLELRERYDVARQALRLQLGFATGAGTNPF